MKKFWWLVLGLLIGSAPFSFGQSADSVSVFNKTHIVFFNFLNIVDPNGNSLQFGYNYQASAWLDLQLELGFVSDDLTTLRSPFKEYAGFRVRPQIKILNKNTVNDDVRWFGSLLLSYQRLNFKENKNFSINNSFNQNITYRGIDQTYAWYIAGGMDIRSPKRLTASLSMGVGQVWVRTRAVEGDIPPNSTPFSDCTLFCGRSNRIYRFVKRPGISLDLKIGYSFGR